MIRIRRDKQYISYILDDASGYSAVAGRVQRKQKNASLLPCHKVYYNETIELLYPIEGKVTLERASSAWTEKEMLEWMLLLLDALGKVKETGFLRMSLVELEPREIFCDPEKKQVYFIVLPLTEEPSGVQWQATLKQTLCRIWDKCCGNDEEKKNGMRRLLAEHGATLEEMRGALYFRLTGNTKQEPKREPKKELSQYEIHFLSNQTSENFDFIINKPEFIIGKHPVMADGIIRNQPTISRRHCKFIMDRDTLYLEDMGSLNRTYVNGVMLNPGERKAVADRDVIQMATLEFHLEFRERKR